DFIDGQRDAVERDGSLWNNKARQSARYAQAKSGAVEKIVPGDEFGHSIDMAIDEVPAELIAQPKRSLQVDARAALPIPGCRYAQCFRRGIGRKERPSAGCAAVHDCEANPRAGNRGADCDRIGLVIAGDNKSPQLSGPFFDVKNLA